MSCKATLVGLGSWVRIRDGGVEEEWCIVPHEEADAARRRISELSPLALALLGHGAGDEVRVQSPDRRAVTIVSVG